MSQPLNQPASQVRLIARYSGRVQGVGFRATVLHHARGLNVNGFVRNEASGDVLLDVDGTKPDLDQLLQRIDTRPAGTIDHRDVSFVESLQRTNGISIG